MAEKEIRPTETYAFGYMVCTGIVKEIYTKEYRHNV